MKIKICGLFRECDADYVNESKPDYVGFVFWSGSKRFVTDDFAAKLRGRIDRNIKTVGVFVDDKAEHTAALYNDGVIDVIQLHGHESDAYINELRHLASGAEIWKAFKIRSAKDIEAAEKSSADRVLLDNGYGTGRCFDWSLAGGIKSEFILAGGITPNNIANACEMFSPWGIDVSSGAETDGVKDKEKIAAIIKAARAYTK